MNQTSVTVTSVHPGGIKTNIVRNSRYAGTDENLIQKFEKSFITSPEKAAKTIIQAIKHKKQRVLVGPDAKLLYFLNRLSPRLIAWGFIQFSKSLINK